MFQHEIGFLTAIGPLAVLSAAGKSFSGDGPPWTITNGWRTLALLNAMTFFEPPAPL